MALDINASIQYLVPIANGVGWIVNSLKILLGGMFGLYVIMLFLRWKELREMKSNNTELKKMHMEMQQMHREFRKTVHMQNHKNKR